MSYVNLQRRTFLAQAGAGAAVLTAGSLLGTANAATAPTDAAPAASVRQAPPPIRRSPIDQLWRNGGIGIGML